MKLLKISLLILAVMLICFAITACVPPIPSDDGEDTEAPTQSEPNNNEDLNKPDPLDELYRFSLNDDGNTYTLYDVIDNDAIDSDLTLPNTYCGKPVVAVADYAFSDCTGIISLTIPEGIQSIGTCAFDGCSSLNAVYVGKDVSSISGNAFSRCPVIKMIGASSENPIYTSVDNCLINTETHTLVLGCSTSTMPKDGSILKIGDDAFSWRQGISSVNIPEGVTEIGEGAFMNCTDITHVIIPSSVSVIKGAAFYGASQLNNVEIYGELTEINPNVFVGCTPESVYVHTSAIELISNLGNSITLVSITGGTEIPDDAFNTVFPKLEILFLPDTITSVGDRAFYFCRSLREVYLPSSATSVGDNAFSECTALELLVLGDSLETVGEYAFSGCTSLKNINIPTTLKSVGEDAFYGCTSLKTVNIKDLVAWCSIDFKDGEYSNPLYYGYSETQRTLLLDGEELSGMVTIPDGVEVIGNCAFYSCDKIARITLPSSLKEIGASAFSCCDSLAEVNIPAGVSRIGDCAFNDSASLSDVCISSLDNWFAIDFGEDVFDDTSARLIVNSVPLTQNTAYIPSWATRIPDITFASCTTLTSIKIPDGVERIGARAFSACTGLTSIVIPNSVTVIDDYAFASCLGLTSVTVSEKLTYLGSHAFNYCDKLTSISLPDTVTYIGVNAFFNCYELKSIKLPASMPADGIDIGAFRSCIKLESITLPQGIETIEQELFTHCYALTSIVIPDSVKHIDFSAFRYCRGLERVYLPASVESISVNAFSLDKDTPFELHITDLDAFGAIEYKEAFGESTFFSEYKLFLNGTLVE